jgi:nucleotide-binding universal stress UspA family protein
MTGSWQGRKEGVMAPVRNILVPLDFSDASVAALRYACGLADVFGASLHVIHATEDPYLPGGYLEFYAPPISHAEEVERDAVQRLEAALTAEEKARYRAVMVHRVGAPAREILEYLHAHADIDLVVMATHGRGGVARLMLGSVTDTLVRTAPCPVVTLRAAEHRAESASAH